MTAVSQGCITRYRDDVVPGESSLVMHSFHEDFDGTSPLILYCHSNGNDATEPLGLPFFGWAGLQYLVQFGFIVISSLWSGIHNWGDPPVVTTMETARTWGQAHGAKSGDIGLWAISMGFTEASAFLVAHPTWVGKVFAQSPAVNTPHLYADRSDLRADMDAAWGGDFTTNGAPNSPHTVLPGVSGIGPKTRVGYSSADSTIRPLDVTNFCASIGITPVDVEPGAAPSGHTSYMSPTNDQEAVLSHFLSLK